MKFSLSVIAVTAALTASTVNAFPSLAAGNLVARAQEEPEKYSLFLQKVKEIKEGRVEKRAGQVDGKDGYREIQALLNPNNFDYNEEQQRVDLTSDEHKYIAPGPNDIRGEYLASFRPSTNFSLPFSCLAHLLALFSRPSLVFRSMPRSQLVG